MILLILKSQTFTLKVLEDGELDNYYMDDLNNHNINDKGLTQKERNNINKLFEKYEGQMSETIPVVDINNVYCVSYLP